MDPLRLLLPTSIPPIGDDRRIGPSLVSEPPGNGLARDRQAAESVRRCARNVARPPGGQPVDG